MPGIGRGAICGFTSRAIRLCRSGEASGVGESMRLVLLSLSERRRLSHVGRMERNETIQKIREQANHIAANVTAIHPLVPGLADPTTQGELLKALYELTKNVEVVKKHLLKLEKRDDSSLV